jgi:hypothetical protein
MRAVVLTAVVLCCGWVQAEELVFSIGQQLSPYTVPGSDPAHFAYLRFAGEGPDDSFTKISTGANAFVGWGFNLIPNDPRLFITDNHWDAASNPEVAALMASISNKPSVSLFVEAPTIESTDFDPMSCQSPTGVCFSYKPNDFVHTTDTSGWKITSIDAKLELTGRNRLYIWEFRFFGEPVPEPASLWLLVSIGAMCLICHRSGLRWLGRDCHK